MAIDILDHIEEVNAVASQYIMGKNETEISKQLDIPRARVASHLKEWKQMASNNEAVRSRAREALSAADQHYNYLIKQAYEVIDDANNQANLSAKTTAIKLVLEIEKERISMLQKAGLLENKELAEQLLETERKQEILVGILKEVTADCSHCRIDVMKRLADMSTTEASVITIKQETTHEH